MPMSSATDLYSSMVEHVIESRSIWNKRKEGKLGIEKNISLIHINMFGEKRFVHI